MIHKLSPFLTSNRVDLDSGVAAAGCDNEVWVEHNTFVELVALVVSLVGERKVQVTCNNIQSRIDSYWSAVIVPYLN